MIKEIFSVNLKFTLGIPVTPEFDIVTEHHMICHFFSFITDLAVLTFYLFFWTYTFMSGSLLSDILIKTEFTAHRKLLAISIVVLVFVFPSHRVSAKLAANLHKQALLLVV